MSYIENLTNSKGAVRVSGTIPKICKGWFAVFLLGGWFHWLVGNSHSMYNGCIYRDI